MADINSSPNNLAGNPDLERAVVVPISVKDLSNKILRDSTVANIDSKRTFYKGLVTFIVDENSSEFRLDDIFLDAIAEQDRNSNTNTTKNNKKLLFVHIPFFTTNSRINTTEISNYDNFNKLKVFYNEDKPVKVGDIALIEFETKQNFLFPIVKQIIPSETAFKSGNTEISLTAFQDVQPYPSLNISPPESQDQIQKKEITRPGGGYSDALKEIEKVFQSDFIEYYTELLQGPDKKVKINLKIEKVTALEELYNYLTSLPITTNYQIIPENDPTKKDYLVYIYASSQTENINNVGFTNGFFNYIKQYFSSTLKFSINPISFGDDFRFSLDVNLNELNGSSKTLNNYLEISKQTSLDVQKNYVFENIPQKSIPGIITDNTGIA